ncbi:hypothetical protein ACEPAI_2056 [Sanghuangporus weigelae]
MHERNPYKTPIDFLSLSDQYPKLKNFLTKVRETNVYTLDFKNAEAQRCLTEALLWRDFRLKLSLPEGRLCPPVPNRLNYLLWIQDILAESFRVLGAPSEIIGIDIGTGASAIYPLLGCKTDPCWKFVGTEIDPISFESAVDNVQQNNLADRITVMKVVSPSFIFVPFQMEKNRTFTFTMCNPPFYADEEEIWRSASSKELEPNSACTGAETEMITPGGEEAFVARMVMESTSVEIKDRCLWFTSMIGKLSSLEKIVEILQANKIGNYALTELVQGQTRRWAVAWSFSDVRLPDKVARDLPAPHHTLIPPHNNFEQPLIDRDALNLRTVCDIVLNVLTPLADISVVGFTEQSIAPRSQFTSSSRMQTTATDEGVKVIRVAALRNSWSRKARRARNPVSLLTTRDMPVMIVDLSVIHNDLKGRHLWVLVGIWRRGRERGLFESFWSHVSGKVCSAVESQCWNRLKASDAV